MAGIRTAMVMTAIRQKIASRALGAGERVPSIRRFADMMAVSPSTVVEAYERLAAEGVISARPGSGYFVVDRALPFSVANTEPKREQAIDPFWVSRQSLDARPDTLKPGCGWLPSDWMPNTALRKALRNVARSDDAVIAEYGGTRGLWGLRTWVARQLADEHLSVEPDQILLTASGTQAIDLICRFLLKPGDTVLVDDPCYFNFQALLRAHQVNIVGVPYLQTGPDTDRFMAALSQHNPRLYITNSALHNPTGATISPQVAHKVVGAAAKHGTIIVEDDIFAEFEPDASPRLAALGGLDGVIRIGSFSKTLSASVRCGYIAARPDWIEALIDLQVATNFGGPSPLVTELLHAVLSDGGYRKHTVALRLRLSRARRQVAGQLAMLDIRPWVMPRGGFYLWCTVPADVDSADMARAALAEDVVLAPGNVFSPSQSMAGFMRFNVSQMTEPKVFAVLARAMKACQDRA